MARKKANTVALETLAAAVETPVVATVAEETPEMVVLETPVEAVAEETIAPEETPVVVEAVAEETPAVVDLETVMDTVTEEVSVEETNTTEETPVVETIAEAKVENRGRKHTFGANFEKTEAIMETLRKFDTAPPSVFLMKQLEKAGFVAIEKGEKVKEGRGRRPYIYRLTEAAAKLISVEETPVVEEIQEVAAA